MTASFFTFDISCRTLSGVFVSVPTPKRDFCKKGAILPIFSGIALYVVNIHRIMLASEQNKHFYKILPTCQSECIVGTPPPPLIKGGGG